MHPLYQRLRELDAESFERLCFHLVKARFPGVEVHHVEGAGGDEGIDLFAGALDSGPTIWQCKAFPNGVKKRQKEQIRASLKAALKHSPQRWILCLSVDLETTTHRWFERLRATYADRVDISLIEACNIVQELAYRSTIREMFFPQAVFDAAALHEIVSRTGRLEKDDLARLNDANVEQYLRRLEEADARFSYAITYGRNVGPRPPRQPRPGLIASISEGSNVVDVFARDVEALKLNPPKAEFTIKGSGVNKFHEFIRSGRPQVIEPEELDDFRTDFPLCPVDTAGAKLMLGPNSEPLPSILGRVTFGAGSNAVVYECIKFVSTRHGREEAEFESTTSLPFRMSLIVNFSGTGSIHFARQCGGYNVHAVQKFLRAVRVLFESGELEVYDLEQGTEFLKPQISGDLPTWFSHYERLISDAVRVADFYGVELVLPEKPTIDDLRALALLRGLIGEVSIPATNITFKLIKCAEFPAERAAVMLGDGAYLLTLPEYFIRPVLFGVPVCTGPIAYQIPRARMENAEEAHEFFESAEIGQEIELSLKPLVAIRARAIRGDLVGSPA